MVPVVFSNPRTPSPGVNLRVNVVAVLVLLVSIAIGIAWSIEIGNPVPRFIALPLGWVLMQSPRVAQQWERAVILRLGRFVGLRGPELFWIVPVSYTHLRAHETRHD